MEQAFRSTRVITSDGLQAAVIVVEGERITQVRRWNDAPAGVNLHDYGDHVLMPGLVDTHVHINEPGRTEWEGFATATQAAAAGGVTTLIDMPLNCIPVTTTAEAFHAKLEALGSGLWVDTGFWGGVTPESL